LRTQGSVGAPKNPAKWAKERYRFTDAPKLYADLRQAIIATERNLIIDHVDDAPPAPPQTLLAWTAAHLEGLKNIQAQERIDRLIDAPSIVPAPTDDELDIHRFW
jgi:hypothetical protein